MKKRLEVGTKVMVKGFGEAVITEIREKRYHYINNEGCGSWDYEDKLTRLCWTESVLMGFESGCMVKDKSQIGVLPQKGPYEIDSIIGAVAIVNIGLDQQVTVPISCLELAR